MKKIGVIDYYLDQYHAENYPAWLKSASGGEVQISYVWAKADKPGGKPNALCAKEMGAAQLGSIAEVVEKSDGLIVMSPDNPELHPELCRLPLLSGKPTYVDKTFTVSRREALGLIETAKTAHTPFFSTSALRYSDEYLKLKKEGIEHINSRGPGAFGNYGIHQVEPITCLMGAGIEKIQYVGTANTPTFVYRFRDGRSATTTQLGWEADFSLALNYAGDHAVVLQGASDFYARFIEKLAEFFIDGIPKVPAEETLQVITILEYGKKAMETPDTWVVLP